VRGKKGGRIGGELISVPPMCDDYGHEARTRDILG